MIRVQPEELVQPRQTGLASADQGFQDASLGDCQWGIGCIQLRVGGGMIRVQPGAGWLARNEPEYGDARAERPSTARSSMPVPGREWDTFAETLSPPDCPDAERHPVQQDSNATRANAAYYHPAPPLVPVAEQSALLPGSGG